MCGLAGIFGSFGPKSREEIIDAMLRVQACRGPDDKGAWYGKVNGVDVGLGHLRLSIIDLSDASKQPMVSEDGRFVLIFNGEIYNYIELRKKLEAEGIRFQTQGDTEVLLKALIKWGTATFSHLNGMWALVLLDSVEGTILLSRDRFGIKPLYLYNDYRGLFVSSEIKGILEVASGKFQVNRNVANAYLCQALMCTSPATFFEGIEEMPAGHMATIPFDAIAKRHFEPRRYWDVPRKLSWNFKEDDLVESVRSTFSESVRLRLRSDVPVGILLSGGIDSSAIAAAVHNIDRSRDDIKIISAVGNNGEYDEQPFIDMVAKHLNRTVEKVVLSYDPEEAFDLITETNWYNDEPVGSFSNIAYYLMMKRAKDLGVTVILTGQGADECLCGYKKFLFFYLHQLLRSSHWLKAGKLFLDFLKTGTVLFQTDFREAKRYLRIGSYFPEIDIRGSALLEKSEKVNVGLGDKGLIERQIADLEKLSVPKLVHYEDRMSMAISREVRLPYLDYRFVSLLIPTPAGYKLRNGWTKWIFRKAIEPWLPREIVWRKDKQHFPVPQNQWLRGKLRESILRLIKSEWISEQLSLINLGKFRLRYENFLRPDATGGLISDHDIFAPIALELWARRFNAYLAS